MPPPPKHRDGVTDFPVPPSPADSVHDHDSLIAARTLLADRYSVDREIGRGGMATVYLAEETKHSRQVASRCCARSSPRR
jgi:serine/threonine protein kinase